MKGTFETAEVVALMWFRTAPRGIKPMFRLQNFLLNKPDWETSQEYCLHIGEAGELETLRNLLGFRRMKKINIITKQYNDRGLDKGEAYIFPSEDVYNAYVCDVERAIGKNVTLSFGL